MNELQRLSAGLQDRYAIDQLIGVGGMANVYRAQDLRHGRTVAIKVLKPELGAVLGGERFASEIRVTASLQHPNLLPLFDSGEVDGLLFYVMPFVDGETLRTRMTREKQLPVDDAVRLLIPLASALAYAHERGVVHRDLKPENVLLQAGQPVIADFGIALAVSNAGGERITQTGLSLGTPQYMSPEQATGDRDIDARSDLYSLGAIAYEMLTGEPPHIGGTSQAIIARLLTEVPRPLVAVRATVPEWLDAVVMRLLEKLPADRFASAALLEEALRTEGVGQKRTTRRTITPQQRGKRTVALTIAGAIVATALAFWAGTRRTDSTGTLPVQRYVITLPDSIIPSVGFGQAGAISPDGASIIVMSIGVSRGQSAWIRRSDALELEPIAGGAEINTPVFSNDGQAVYYQDGASETLRRVRLVDRRIETLAPMTARGGGLEIMDDGRIVASAVDSSNGGLSITSRDGGDWASLTRATAAGEFHVWPVRVSGSSEVLFSINRGPNEKAQLAIVDATSKKLSRTGVPGVRPLGVLDGRLVYIRSDGMLMAIPIDALHARQRDAAIPLGIRVQTVGPLGTTTVAMGRSGALIVGTERAEFRVASFGATEPIRTMSTWMDVTVGIWALSPAHDKLLYISSADRLQRRVTFLNIETGQVLGRSMSSGVTGALWDASGNAALLSTSSGNGKTSIVREGVGVLTKPDTIAVVPSDAVILSSALGDNRYLVSKSTSGGSLDIVELAHSSKGKWQETPVASSGANEISPSVSPDGRWIAFQSDPDGFPTIYVKARTANAAAVPLSRDTTIGLAPLWSPDGSAIYYASSDGLLHRITLQFDAQQVRPTENRTIPNLVDGATPRRGVTNLLQGERFIPLGHGIGNRLYGVLARFSRSQFIYTPNWRDEYRAKIRAAADGR